MSFTNNTVLAVWNKAKKVTNTWGKDQCSAWINFNDYGNRNSEYGWEIDHITPVSHGGANNISNLRPLHWKNNLSKSNSRLTCTVRSSGTQNNEI